MRKTSKMSEWRRIKTYKSDIFERVDLWLSFGASPLTMGMADSFRVTDCWQEGNKWFHNHCSVKKELNLEMITHWRRRPIGPNGEKKY